MVKLTPSSPQSLSPLLVSLLLLISLSAPVSADNGGAGEPYPPVDSDPAIPRVVSPRGTYVGTRMTSGRQQRRMFAFTGIRYARPPLGDLRFANPVPYPPPTEEYQATHPSPECLQWDHLRMRGTVGQEDCLFLDIYNNHYPGIETKKSPQPVVAFIHAGSWLAGGGAQDLFTPDYLIENDVVVVTINHRLGAFGFLSTQDEAGPGNYGMRDVILALEWIRNNVWYFGGMNESVTVMGSGAGGTTAHLLTLSPLARGSSLTFDDHSLLARAISHSGTAYTPHAISRSAKAQTLQLAALVGCSVQLPSADLITCLRTVKASVLVDTTPSLFRFDEEPLPFGPVIDPWMGEQAFLPDEPHRLIHRGDVLQIPWLAGTNRDDGAFRVQDILKDPGLVQQLNKDWDKNGPVLLHITKDSCKDPAAVSRQIKEYYMKGQPFGEASSKQFVEMMTDRFFVYPTERALQDHRLAQKGESTYCFRYLLDYCGRKSFLDILHQETQAAAGGGRAAFGLSNPRFQNTRDAHGWGVGFMDELLFLFPSPKLKLLYKQMMDSDSSSAVSTHMIMFWTNFIKGGDPTPVLKGYPEDISPWGAWWEPYYPGYDFYLKIDPDMNSQEEPYKPNQLAFWDSLPLFENKPTNVIRDEL